MCKYLQDELVSERVEGGYNIFQYLHCDKYDEDFSSPVDVAMWCIKCGEFKNK